MKTQEGSARQVLSDQALDQLCREARSHSVWLERPVSDDTLRQLHELMKWGPTSAIRVPRGSCSTARRQESRNFFLRSRRDMCRR